MQASTTGEVIQGMHLRGFLLRLSAAMIAAMAPLVAVASGAPLVDGFESDYTLSKEYQLRDGASIYYLEPVRDLEERTMPSIGDAVLVDGPIIPAALGLLESLLRSHKVRYLYLRSFGGYVSSAVHIGELVRKRGIVTVVEANQSCYSACAFIFLSGVRRIADAAVNDYPRIAFHAPFIISPDGDIPVARGSKDGAADCAYFRNMVSSQTAAENLCAELFATQSIVTHPTQALIDREIATDSRLTFMNRLADELPPADQLPEAEKSYYRCKLAEEYSATKKRSGKVYIPPAQVLVDGAWQNLGSGSYVGAATACEIAISEQCSGPIPARHRLLYFSAQRVKPTVCPLQ
jgi:hypothetical protein